MKGFNFVDINNNFDYKMALKQYREDSGFTQSELARMVGLSRATISSSENGKHIPSLSTLEKLAKFYNVNIPALLSASPYTSVKVVLSRGGRLGIHVERDEELKEVYNHDLVILGSKVNEKRSVEEHKIYLANTFIPVEPMETLNNSKEKCEDIKFSA